MPRSTPTSGVGPEPVVLWGTLVVALVVHEGSHYVRLRLAGLHPRPSFHFPGIGWRFEVGDCSPGRLRSIWLIGPLMESLTWSGAALLFPAYAIDLMIVMVVELAVNLLFPGSDGRRVWRSWRREQAARRARPQSLPGPG